MKNIKNIYLFIFLISSLSAAAQSVTFQSYMQTIPWADEVLLNGNPLVETSSGVFEIVPEDVLPGKNVIEFVSLPGSLNGISTLDLVMIRRALEEIQALDPTDLIPADINHSNFVGIEDIVILRNRIVGWDSDYSQFKYAFVHPSVDLNALDIFDFGTDVYKFCFEGSDLGSIDFTFDVYQSGDVNKSAQFKGEDGETSKVRSENLKISIVNSDVEDGERFEIPFSIISEDDIEALQFELKNKGIIIESIELDGHDQKVYLNNSDEDKTRIMIDNDSPTNEISGTLFGEGAQNAKLSDIISISSDFKDEVVYSDLNVSGVSIEYGSILSDDQISIDELVISPNPVQDHFMIKIPSRLTGKSNITVTNASGQVVLQQTMSGNSIQINRDRLGAAGQYVLTWSHENKVINKTLLVL